MAWGRTITVAAVVVAVGVAAAVVLRAGDDDGKNGGGENGGSGNGATPTTTVSPRTSTSPVPGWAGTWAAAMQRSDDGYRDQTLRQIVRTSIGGDQVRVRISNEFGSVPLTVANLTVARSAGEARTTGAAQKLTIGGAQRTTIGVGQSVLTDAAAFAVPAGGELAVSMFVPDPTGAVTQHALANRTNYVAAGDQTGSADLTSARGFDTYAFLSAVDVHNSRTEGAVVALGASITDGFHSTFGTNQRWPDLLSQRLSAAGRTVGVLNLGISGNQITKDGAGESALKRFDRDVLGQTGVKWVIISDNALNDLGDNNGPTQDALLAGVRQLIDRGHQAGIGVICSTLTPFEGADYWSERGEAGRAAVNALLRDPATGCDGLIDQDTALHDPAAPTRFLAAYDSGDHLHPNDAGMKAIADAADPGIFKD